MALLQAQRRLERNVPDVERNLIPVKMPCERRRVPQMWEKGTRCFIAELTSENILNSDTVDSEQSNNWIATVGRATNFKLDTGAEVTAETYRSIEPPPTATKKLCCPSRQPLKTRGQGIITDEKRLCGRRIEDRSFGTTRNHCSETSNTGWVASVTKTETSTTTEVEKRFPSVFSGLGNLGEEYEIPLRPEANPHSLFTPRRVPLPLRPKVEEELNRMESLGVISRAIAWCAGMVVVPKKKGAIRINYVWTLNPSTKMCYVRVHPLPKVDDILAQLAGAKVFSKLDANNGDTFG